MSVLARFGHLAVSDLTTGKEKDCALPLYKQDLSSTLGKSM